MEGGNSCSLVPFAKQSRIVSRDQPDSSSSDFSNSNFWDKLNQQSNSSWMEGHYKAPPLLTSGCIVRRPAEAKTEPFSWQMVSNVQKLPSPKELYQRKKKGLKRKSLENARALSVCSHLEELKRRQSSIEELKKAKWGGLVTQPFSEEQEGADLLIKAADHKDPMNLFNMPRQAEFFEKDSVFNRRSTVQFLYPEWSPTMQERPVLPPENALLSSYTRAAQDRDHHVATGCLPEEDFLGFRLQLEE